MQEHPQNVLNDRRKYCLLAVLKKKSSEEHE